MRSAVNSYTNLASVVLPSLTVAGWDIDYSLIPLPSVQCLIVKAPITSPGLM